MLCPMQAQTATFHTHAFVKRLPRAGMPEDQAEILAKGQSDLYERMVTKEYFEFTLKHELEKLRAEQKNDADRVQANLEQVKAKLKHDIDKVRVELKYELEEHKTANSQALKELDIALKHGLETTKTELKRDIRGMEQKLTIKLGVLLAISVTVLATLITFF